MFLSNCFVSLFFKTLPQDSVVEAQIQDDEYEAMSFMTRHNPLQSKKSFFELTPHCNDASKVVQSKATKYRKEKSFFDDLNSLFTKHDIKLNTDKSRLLKKYLSNFEYLDDNYCHNCDLDKDILQKKIKSLHLRDRNHIISCLSLTTTNSVDKIDSVLVAAYPFLAERGQQLLEKSVRKERFDAIDLNVISSFMHNLCR